MHEHAWEHEILIHAGAGQVLQNGTWRGISAGATIFIPGQQAHQLRNNSTKELVFAGLIPAGAPEL